MKQTKRILSVVLCLVMVLAVVPVMNVGAICCRKDYFDKSKYTLTGNMAYDVAMIAKSQKGRTQSDFGYTEAWCDEFVADCIENAGGDDSIVAHGGTVRDFYSVMYNRGARETSSPAAGDLVFFSGYSHVEIVTKVENGVVYCAGGNNSGSKCAGERTVSSTGLSVSFYLHPNYPSFQAPNPISIQEGVYSIHSARDKNMVLDIAGDSQASGANIQLYNFLDNNVQKFRIAKSGNYYTIQSVYSGNWLDIKTPIGNRSNVQLFYLNTNDEEKWFFEDAGNGYVAIRNYYGYYLDIAGDSAVDHANIQVYNTLESDSQKWRLVPDAPSSSINIPEGVYTIHSAWNKNKVLDIQGDSQASGANIQLFDFKASNYDVQRFRVIKSGKYYTIQSVYSNNWLDIATPITHRSNIQLYYKNTFNEEKWFFEDAGNGYVNIRNYYGYYVDIAGDSTENRANIQAFRTKYNNSQRWWLVPDNYTININANGGTASTSSFSAKYGNKCDLSTSFVQRTGGYKLKGWNLYRPADGKWHVAGEGWKTPEEISAGGYEKQLYVPNLSMTLDYTWIYSFSGLVSSISSFTFYAVWEECSHTWNSGTVIKEATASEEGIIRYTCTTCGETKDVSVAVLQPTGITVDLTRVKLSYYVGESLNTSGLKLSATYSDGTTETVTEGFTCTASKLTTPGTQTITVSYAGKTCTYEVNVKVEESAPYWGDMNGNKKIDDSDAELIKQYLKGSVQLSDEQKCFADLDFNGNVNATDYTILQRYAKGYEPISATSKTAINLITTKSNYNTGDPLEPETFQIVVSSTDSAAVSYTIADGFELSGYDPNMVGIQTISTTFRGIQLSTTITVVKVEHTHSYTSTVTKAATCSTTGVKTFTCSCGDSYTETIPENTSNHVNTTNVSATASTCTVKGFSAGVYCNDCKQYISGHQEQPLAAHTTELRNAREATCTAEGYTGDQYCTTCKQTISTGTAIGKKAHTLTTINQKAANCTEAGYTGDQYCTTCKQTISKGSATNALGHANADGNGNCTRCGAHIKDVTQPTQPQPQPQPSGGCKYCGGTHSGPFGWLIQFFHNILAIFKR